MNTETCPSNDVGNAKDSPLPTTVAPSIFDALHAVAHAMEYRINLTDHRGRRFLDDFYIDNAPAVGRCGVWGFSASGASQLVAWPCGAKGRGRKNAQWVADQLNEAAAAWCVRYGPLPKSKPKAKKKRK